MTRRAIICLVLWLAFCGLLVAIANASPASDARAAARPAMAAYKAAHPACEWCGRASTLTERLEVHHLVPCATDPTRAADTNNMITLCRRDHIAIGHAGDRACRRYLVNVREIIAARVVAENKAGAQ